MTKQTLIVFSHGKESGPNGAKIQRLAKVGSHAGAQVLSVDYSGMDDPELRVQKLLSYDLPAHDQLILVVTCLVLSDHFHLETKAPVVELLFHPDTYSSGV